MCDGGRGFLGVYLGTFLSMLNAEDEIASNQWRVVPQ